MPHLPSGRTVGIQTLGVEQIAHSVKAGLPENDKHRLLDAMHRIKTVDDLLPFVKVLFFREMADVSGLASTRYHSHSNRPQAQFEPYQSGFTLADWAQFTADWSQADKDAFRAFLAEEGTQSYLQEALDQVAAFDMLPFYAQFEGARDFVLSFPADKDGVGPFWQESGELDLSLGTEQAEEDVALVNIGADHYLLACRHSGPFSTLRLHWGDEFMAERTADNALILTRIIAPRKFKHYRFVASEPFNNDNPIAQVVHRHGGGWETVAGGMLTLTVPSHAAADLEREMEENKLIPGVIRLEV